MPDYDTNPLCYVADSPIHGHGLFARKDIPAGRWIGYYEGPETEENGIHVLWVESGTEEDGQAQWTGYNGNNELRFLNHARRPNSEMDGLDLYASQDIKTGQEITIDYGEEFESKT